MTDSAKNRLTRPLTVCLIALVCCALWGSAFPCIKIGYQLLGIDGSDRATQILFAGLRFTIAGILTLIIGSLMRRRPLLPRRADLASVAKLSLFQTILQYLFFYMGLAATTGVKASIITGSNSFIAILLTTLAFRQEKMTAPKLWGCILGFAGVVLINVSGASLSLGFALTGEGFILISAVASAFSSVLIKNYSKDTDPVILSGSQFILGGLVLMACGAAAGGSLNLNSTPGILLLLYLGALSATAYTLWSILLKYNPVSRVAVFGFMTPVAGVILSALLLGEGQQALTLESLAALVLVSAGIYIVNRQKPERLES